MSSHTFERDEHIYNVLYGMLFEHITPPEEELLNIVKYVNRPGVFLLSYGVRDFLVCFCYKLAEQHNYNQVISFINWQYCSKSGMIGDTMDTHYADIINNIFGRSIDVNTNSHEQRTNGLSLLLHKLDTDNTLDNDLINNINETVNKNHYCYYNAFQELYIYLLLTDALDMDADKEFNKYYLTNDILDHASEYLYKRSKYLYFITPKLYRTILTDTRYAKYVNIQPQTNALDTQDGVKNKFTSFISPLNIPCLVYFDNYYDTVAYNDKPIVFRV